MTLFYSGENAFVDGTLPFITGALAAEEPVLVAISRDRIALLTEALGGDASHVQFTDMHLLGSNPARIIPAWRRFLDERAPDGRPVRGIGEPVWAGRRDEEVIECQRHESLLNVAFDRGQAWSLLCPYDVEALRDDVIRAAEESHPFIAERSALRPSHAYSGPDGGLGVFDGVLDECVAQPSEVEFTGGELGRIRSAVSEIAAAAGLPATRIEDLVLAVNELASNTVYHGGGVGKLRVWSDGPRLTCEVSDRGRITDPLVGRVRPRTEQWSGRGLWLVNQVCDLTQIRSDPAGTVVRVQMAVA